MTTYNTGNAVGSTAVKDLYDNAENFDDALNGSGSTWTDRRGRIRKSWASIENNIESVEESAKAIIAGLGYQVPIDYESGIVLTEANQTILYDGNVYAPIGSELPFTTSGSFEVDKFRLIQGVSATDLSASTGAQMLGYRLNATNSVLRTQNDKNAELVSVRDFGANGLDDDTDAINKALSWLRDSVDSASELRPFTLTGGGGIFTCEGPLDFSFIKSSKGWGMRDMRIRSYAKDKTVADMLGSRLGVFENVHIRAGDPNDNNLCPWDGLLLGIAVDNPSGHMTFANCTIDGYFKGAAYHNYASEELLMQRCIIWNRREPVEGEPAYAGVLDGRGEIPIVSDFATPKSGRSSYTVGNYVSCAFQKPFAAQGTALYLRDFANHSFSKLYATNGGGGPIILWRVSADFVPYNIDIDVQMETSGSKVAFEFQGGGTGTYRMNALSIKTGNLFPDEAFFKASDLDQLSIGGLTLRVPKWNAGTPTDVFAPASKFFLTNADIMLPALSDLPDPSSFAGLEGTFHALGANYSQHFGAIRQQTGSINNNGGIFKIATRAELADDAVHSLDITNSEIGQHGILFLWSTINGVAATVFFLASGTPRVMQSTLGTQVEAVTGTTLTGTTGTDGKLTISINDAQIQFENRLGQTAVLRWSFLTI